MEVAVIDWKTIDSRFVKDDLYEHINAPKWVDFSAPEIPVDDEAWFCRPGCNHPKTVEDFFDHNEGGTPSSTSKHKKSASVSDVSPFGNRDKREAMLKKRGGVVNNQPFGLSSKGTNYHRIVDDGENQDPNLSTPKNYKARAGKEAIKSSAEKKEFRDDTSMGKEQMPKLRSTLSARNLFSGGDFLNKVAEFCNELKKLAIRPKDKENAENVDKQEAPADESLAGVREEEKERKPLLELGKEKSKAMGTPASRTKQRKKIRNNDAENTPVSIDMNKIKQQEAEEGVLQIRTFPPTPQCFSAIGHGAPKDTPPKRSRPRPLDQDRGILQELKQTNKEVAAANNNRVVRQDHENTATTIHGEATTVKEVKPLDVFWFLKPCTTLSS